MAKPHLETLTTRALDLWQAHGRETPLPGVILAVSEQPMGPIHGVYQPSLCIVLQGAKISRVGQRSYHYDAGKCLIASLDVPVRAEIITASAAEPYVALVVNIDPAVVAELLLDHPITGQNGESCPEALAVQPLSADLIDPLERLLNLAHRPHDIPVLAPMVQREITWQLLNGGQAGALRQIGLADSRVARIGKSIAWVRENFTQTLSVPHLARLAGMSPATFHRQFKAATAMTPVQFQKSLRLQAARRMLLADGVDVAQVGFAIGYESPSQFSREYSRMFGVPPGRDGAQMRGAVAMDSRA
ncbi:helix-turn-helix domain-containing protein [Epibacterium sp. SM1969]|uniref:Helix-turn-helix domain-containing protein n=1 Tax=Tritonibacter aquimaris TaxID=2663379 RepID=A0A844AS83_9RHOB|nr:AraC family transcriptional regulator [Tritonibacter aquimaris]MQY43943.1 helix-turn-helix domain-containing protein [Tritonibacter aquimaris]